MTLKFEDVDRRPSNPYDGPTGADESGSAAAKAHRGIFKIRDVLSSGNSGIYSECARGDEYLASSYDDAIAAVDGDPKWDFLVDQRAKVQAAVKEAKSLA